MADGVEQMGFAEAGIAVKEKRIVCNARRLGDGNTGCMSETIAGADDKVGKCIIGVKP